MSNQGGTKLQNDIELQAIPKDARSLYPRPDFENLNRFLTQGKSQDPYPTAQLVTDEPFVTVMELSTGHSRSFASTNEGQLAFLSSAVNDAPVLVFLRGFGSPSWLDAVHTRYGARAEFYRRHLDCEAFKFKPRNYFTSQGLPSSSSRVFQISIPTLCSKGPRLPVEPEDLREIRQLSREKMNEYYRYLRDSSRVADSILREHVPLDKETDLVEQKVTVEIGGEGLAWRALVWLDSGRDISECAEQRWKPHPKDVPWTYFLPVINHLESETRNAATVDLVPDNTLLPPILQGREPSPMSRSSRSTDWKANQNACVLPFQYGRHHSRPVASRNTMYALGELFEFAAAAQVQMLNKLQSLLEQEMSYLGLTNDGQLRAISLVNLRYIKAHLGSYKNGSLLETVTMLENIECLDWPTSHEDKDITSKTSRMVLADYRYLQERARSLSQEVEHGMTALANASVLEESRRSAENASRVQRLTMLATVFIPLSFVCAVWGMNFKEMGSGTKSIWWWVVTSMPVLGLSLLIYFLQRVRDLIGENQRKRNEAYASQPTKP